MLFRTLVTRTFNRGEFLLAHGRTLASEEASYKTCFRAGDSDEH
jgi:hypothetical protein